MITEIEKEEIFSKRFTIKPRGAENHPLISVIPGSMEEEIINLITEDSGKHIYRANAEDLQKGGDEYVEFTEQPPLIFKKH